MLARILLACHGLDSRACLLGWWHDGCHHRGTLLHHLLRVRSMYCGAHLRDHSHDAHIFEARQIRERE
jgi:hypothetical protein